MSWQNYIDNHIMATRLVKKSVIAGHDGTTWAKSSAMNATKDELKSLADNIADQSQLPMCGVVMDGEKFFYLSGTDKVVRCKKGKSGLHAIRTHKAIIVAVFEEPVQHPQIANIIESVGEYLMSMGY